MKKLILTAAATSAIILGGISAAGAAGNNEHIKKAAATQVDTNQDGKISMEEHLALAEKRFNATDLNNDGFVTRKEALEVRAKVQERMKNMKE